MANTGIKIWWDSTIGAYHLITPYKAEFVEALKQIIPVSDRHWDSQTKSWVVTERVMEPLRRLSESAFNCKAHCVTRAEVEEQESQAAAQAAQAGSNHTLTPAEQGAIDFLKLIPFSAARKAYLAACLEMHPDKHPGDAASADRMSRMNEAWQRVERGIYGK